MLSGLVQALVVGFEIREIEEVNGFVLRKKLFKVVVEQHVKVVVGSDSLVVVALRAFIEILAEFLDGSEIAAVSALAIVFCYHRHRRSPCSCCHFLTSTHSIAGADHDVNTFVKLF